ncbi:hypothetical protein PF006_g9810 [Phytophthora fragariae]|uniref:RING-type E3 ubiquitin transferase n=1 Tax=Phytophthora fragariae TaxID=53985 RepID=A0A6A3U2H0_9STRA|nr:hypothetical protein PF006_g9810 [Phytophthora fragariae]
MAQTQQQQSPPRNPYTFTREEYDDLVQQTPNCQLSQRSKYEEVELVDDCTLFDIYRQPRAPVTDPLATKTLSVRQLNADLTCPICLGIIKETMVVMECLHRFCGECISTAIRHSKRECPSCRIHIPSKRSLRPDANFDALIAKIHPNLAEFERNEDQIIQKLNRTRLFNNAYTESTRMGVLSQAASRRHGGRKKAEGTVSASSSPSNGSGASPPVGEKRNSPGGGSPSDNNAPTSAAASEDESARKKQRVDSAASTAASVKPKESDRVTLRVLLHEDERSDAPKLERTLFTTFAKLKVRHLKKHLAALLKMDKYDNMCIVLPTVNCSLSGLSAAAKARKSGDVAIRQDLQCDQELEDFVTLRDIYQQYGMGTEWELRLLYHFSPGTIVNGIAQFVSKASVDA